MIAPPRAMIYYLCKRRHQYTIRWRLQQDFDVDVVTRRELLRRLCLLSYETAFRLRSLPAGTYIFADLERLSPEETERAAIIWHTLAEHGYCRLNDPVRSMRRFELLRHLREHGINDFDVRRLTDSRALRFPVFIRSENDHEGSKTTLLGLTRELDGAIARLTAQGRNREDKLVVEFCDVADAAGIYHRYGAHIVGRRIFASNLFFSSHWTVKRSSDSTTAAQAAAERMYVETNPHEAPLREIFHMARIEYGRIDYAVVKDHIRVFEINTNPVAPAAAHLLVGAREIDCTTDPASRIPVRREFKPPWREELSWAHWVSRGVHTLLWKLHLLAIEAPVQRWLRRTKRWLVRNRERSALDQT